MRVLVTGANGYLGSGVVKCLLDSGHNVVATDFDDEHIDKRAKFIKGNIFDLESPYDFFEKPDILIHMAWRDGFVHDSESHIIDLPKHFAFLKKMCESDIKTIAVIGTMHEIGFYEGMITEHTPCNPSSFYGIAKNSLREITKMLCAKYSKYFLWLRGFYIIGNFGRGNSVFSKLYFAAMEGKKSFPLNSGKNKYDFLSYDEFCIQVARSCVQTDVTGIVNICSGKPVQLSIMIEKFIKDNDLNIRIDYGVYPERQYDSKCIYGDNTKIKQIIKDANK